MSNPTGLSSLTPPGTPTSKRRATFVWTPVFPENLVTPCMRSKHASCLVDNFIYVFGGRDAHSSRKDLWRYNITTNVWTSLECSGMAPPLLQDHTMVCRDNKLYIFGGELGFGTSDETSLWSYDFLERSWAKQVGGTDVKKPLGRRGHTANIANDAMYVYGGYLDLKGSSSELWLYDFESDSWHIDCLSQLNEPPARHNHSAVLHNNCIWIYGGLSNLVPKADLWKWDIDSRKWLRIRFHQGPTTLNGHSACVHNDSMYIFGGEDGTTTARNDLWLFSFVTHTWSKISPFQGILPSPSLHHTLLPVLTEVHLNSHPNVQYRAASVPHLQPDQHIDVASPPRPYSSPPVVDRSPSPYGGQVSRVFQNRVGPRPTGLLSPTAAEHTVIVNRNAEEVDADSNIIFHKKKLNFCLDDDLEQEERDQSSVWNDENENVINVTQDTREECSGGSLTEQCGKRGRSNESAVEKADCGAMRPDSLPLFDEQTDTQCNQELKLVDLEQDIEYLNFTEQTKLITLQKHSRIYRTDQSNGFYNNGYVPVEDCHGNNVQRPIDIHHRESYANSNRTKNLDEKRKVINHQRDNNILIPKIIEPVKQREYGRSNTVDAQDVNKHNGHTQWYLAKQGDYSKQDSENVLCMYLIGGKEVASNSVTGIKTPLAMWKCAVIPGKPSSQQIRKLMAEITP